MENSGTFLAAGDVFITRRLQDDGYEGINELSSFIKEHDIRFANLEVTVHDREGYPFLFSGGTWAMANPVLLKDLDAYHFNIWNAANNHSMDYSHNGLLATIKNLKNHQMNFAGIGENLADASAPVYIETENMRVALIGVTSTFHESWAAGNQRVDMKGRPGVNPLRYKTKYHVEKRYLDALKELAPQIDINAQKNLDIKEGFAVAPKEAFHFGNYEFVESGANKKETKPLEIDMHRIRASIQEAKKQADCVLVSIHSHEMTGEDKERPAEFLKDFAHQCIDAGANVILGHGPHILRGIEIYNKGLIFYSLGNFIFENDTTTHQPADFYEKYNMDNTAMVGEGMDKRSKEGQIGLGVNENVWRSCLAEWRMLDGVIKDIKLYPIHLGYDLKRYRRGLPKLAHDDELLHNLAKMSKEFGTTIRIENHIGIVNLNNDDELMNCQI